MDERNKRTLYCGNLSEKVTEELLYELFLQAGPLECVKIPKDKNGRHRNYAFITFKHEVSVPYTVALMQGITLFGREIRLELRTGAESDHNRYMDVLIAHKQNYGRNGFVGNSNISRDCGRRDSPQGFVAYPIPGVNAVNAFAGTPVAFRGYSQQTTPLSDGRFNGFGNGQCPPLHPAFLNSTPLNVRDKLQAQNEWFGRSPCTPVAYMPSPADNKRQFRNEWRDGNRRYY